MPIAGLQLRDHRTVAQYEAHYEGHRGYTEPCPACGEHWSEPDHLDRSRELVHAQGCDFMVWLREDDPEDEG